MRYLATLFIVAVLAAAGCNDAKPTPAVVSGTETKETTKSKELSAEDQAAITKQKVCPISDEPLDAMGGPIKVMIEGKPVFLCCKSCEKTAMKKPEETLKKVEELKAKNAPKAP
jgi:hypothetical protein